MLKKLNFKKISFLVYGLGSTGQSVVKFFKKKKIKDFLVWDDKLKSKNKYEIKKLSVLKAYLKKVDFIVLSPGINLNKSKYKQELKKYRKKIITDLDLLYLFNPKLKSIVVTGTNGKSTTCKIIYHLLKEGKFNVKLGGNIGTPVLDLYIKKGVFVVIEASSYQLSYSKFVKPNYAILLNITTDHLDWHGSMANYISSKLKIFQLQDKNDFALINISLKKLLKKNKFLSKLFIINSKEYKNIKTKIQNDYLNSSANNENVKFVYKLSKLLKIKEEIFIDSMNSFRGLPHRYEIFLKKRNITFVNDSKATSLRASKLALENNKNIFWIVGGLPKNHDKISFNKIKKNIIYSYIIGKNINFFKKKLSGKIKFKISKNLKFAIKNALGDIKLFKNDKNTILLSPGAASFDQFENFEKRGNEFKRLSKKYAKKFI